MSTLVDRLDKIYHAYCEADKVWHEVHEQLVEVHCDLWSELGLEFPADEDAEDYGPLSNLGNCTKVLVYFKAHLPPELNYHPGYILRGLAGLEVHDAMVYTAAALVKAGVGAGKQ